MPLSFMGAKRRQADYSSSFEKFASMGELGKC